MMGLAFRAPSTKRTESVPAAGSRNFSVWDPREGWNWLVLGLEKPCSEEWARQVRELVRGAKG
jgi:hypothetical protein